MLRPLPSLPLPPLTLPHLSKNSGVEEDEDPECKFADGKGLDSVALLVGEQLWPPAMAGALYKQHDRHRSRLELHHHDQRGAVEPLLFRDEVLSDSVLLLVVTILRQSRERGRQKRQRRLEP